MVHDQEALLVHQLTSLIRGGNAHATFEDAITGLLFEHTGVRPNNVPYSIWKLLEHIRIAQWDILEFSRNPAHQSPQWPEEYWPPDDAPGDLKSWHNTIEQIKQDREAFINLLQHPDTDLFKPFEHGKGQNLLREAMLIADHMSYHLGQIILIRRLLSDWKM